MDTGLPPSPKTLVIIDSRKGGTGKTTCAMAVMEKLAGRPGVWAFDFRGPHGDLAVRYGATPITPAAPGSYAPFFAIGDVLSDPTSDVNLVVIDVGALQDNTVDRFLEGCHIAQLARDGALRIVFLWVCGSNPFVLSELAAAMQEWRTRNIPADVALIANEGGIDSPDILAYVGQTATGASLRTSGVPLIVLPHLEGIVMQQVQLLNARFGDYANTEAHAEQQISRSSRMVVRHWLDTCIARLSQLPFLTQTVTPSDAQGWTLGDAPVTRP